MMANIECIEIDEFQDTQDSSQLVLSMIVEQYVLIALQHKESNFIDQKAMGADLPQFKKILYLN